MKITVNGQNKELSETINVAGLIAQFCKDGTNVIAEVNGDIVKKDQWNRRIIGEGDEIELVRFVGGG